jgi:hypothetical protein
MIRPLLARLQRGLFDVHALPGTGRWVCHGQGVFKLCAAAGLSRHTHPYCWFWANVLGIHVLRVQPRVRQQSCVEQDLGSAWFSGARPCAGGRQVEE